MILLYLASVLAYNISDLKACLDLVKWKIDTYEENFDKILALSTLNPEMHLDKIIGEMLQYCANNVNEGLKEQIFRKEDLISLDNLAPFPVKKYEKEEELELNKEQEEILKELEQYASTIDNTDYWVLSLAASFTFVVILVLLRKVPYLIKSQKFFKLD